MLHYSGLPPPNYYCTFILLTLYALFISFLVRFLNFFVLLFVLFFEFHEFLLTLVYHYLHAQVLTALYFQALLIPAKVLTSHSVLVYSALYLKTPKLVMANSTSANIYRCPWSKSPYDLFNNNIYWPFRDPHSHDMFMTLFYLV